MEGTTLSHFRILSRIGQGGMGVVYKAEDVNLGRTVAIKVLPAELVQDAKRRARFVTEARAAAAVTHPNIATIYEIDQADDTTFIAMEYLDGETLRSRLANQPLPVKQAVDLAAQIAEGLAAAHGAKVVHRDLKPDNVMITRDGHAKILDFGLARLVEPASHTGAGDETVMQTQALTDPQAILGTPAYMSPEQARGLEVDFRTDIFSFGCTFYEMLTGKRPFHGRTSTDTISDILTKTPVPIIHLNPELPSALQWILDKCLDKEVDDRYRDTRDLVVDLHHLQRDPQSLTSGVLTSHPGALPGIQTPQPTPSQGGVAPASQAGLHVPTPAESGTVYTTGGTVAATGTVGRRRIVTAGVALIVLALGLFGVSRMSGRSSVPDVEMAANSLAIFAFENRADTEDPQRYGQIFQDVLITALSGLEPFKVYSGQRLFDIQKQLSRGSENAFDKEFATDVARHAGAEHMLTGSLGQLGDKWILTCQMVQVSSGTVVLSKRIDGVDLYEVADVLTSELKADLRIAAPTEVASEISVRDKTSTSLEAYREYLEGNELLNNNKFQEAAERFRAAIDIDPEFGQAYFKLAAALSWPGDDPDAAKDIYNEFLRRELYTSDKERRLAETARDRLDSQYAEILPKQRQLVLDYPDEKEVWYELGETLFHFPGGAMEEEALEAFEKALELDPDFLLPYQHIFDVLWRETRFDEALQRSEALVQRDPDNPIWHRFRAATLVLVTEESGIDAVVDEALRYQKTPEDRRELYKEVADKVWAQAPNKRREYLEKARAADPGHDDPMIVNMLLQDLRNRALWDEYESWIREALEESPDNRVLRGRLIDVYEQTRRYEEGLAYVRKLSRENPDNPRAPRIWTRLAIAGGNEGEIRAASHAAERAAKTTDDKRMLLEQVAWGRNIRGDENGSLEAYREALRLDPDGVYPNLYNNMGWRQLARGRYDAARRDFQRAAELNPSMIGAHFGLYLLARNQGNHAEADSAMNRLLSALPPGPFAVLGPASSHLRAGRLQEAQEIFEEYLKQPRPAWEQYDQLNDIGDQYLDAGYVNEALVVFRRAAQLDLGQRSPRALNNVGLCHLVRGDYAEAERALLQARDVTYPTRATSIWLATAQLLLGKLAEAEATLQAEEDLRPHAQVDRLRVLVRMAQKRYVEARDLAARCVAMDSSRASHELLAWTLIRGELDVDAGMREAERALRLPIPAVFQWVQLPCWPPAEHSLGLAALAEGDPERALAHLRRASERMPKRTSLLEDLRRVEAMVAGTP